MVPCRGRIRFIVLPRSGRILVFIVVVVVMFLFTATSLSQILHRQAAQLAFGFQTTSVEEEAGQSNNSSNVEPEETVDEQDDDGIVPSISCEKGPSSPQPRNLHPGPIFYNLYVPIQHRNSSQPNVTSLLWEQLEQIKLSSPNSTLLYTLILDEEENVPNSYADHMRRTVRQFCSGHCRELVHVRQGSEATTLKAVRQYCQGHGGNESDRDEEIVTYIHDKGSLHYTNFNDKERRFSTKAALECRRSMMSKPEECNVCTAKFFMFPQYLGSAK